MSVSSERLLTQLQESKPKLYPSLARITSAAGGRLEQEDFAMPKRKAKSIETGLTRCRSEAASLGDELLTFLIDIALRHLRRPGVRPESYLEINDQTIGCLRLLN